MSNFTWADIYAPYARELGGQALRLVADLRSDYRHATAFFRMQPSMKIAWLKPSTDVGMVVNQGRNRRSELVAPSASRDATAWCISTSADTARMTWTGRGSSSSAIAASTSPLMIPRRRRTE